MIILKEEDLNTYITDTLKDIAKNLDAVYFDKSTSSVNKGIINVGNINMSIIYDTEINTIRVQLNQNITNFDCTNNVSGLLNLCKDSQKASLIIKTIQESDLMSNKQIANNAILLNSN